MLFSVDMKHLCSRRVARIAVLCLLATACGPQVELEDDGSSSGAASSTGSVETTGGPMTASPTTASPTDGSVTLTSGPVYSSTSVADPDSSTGPVFPEYCSPVEQDCPPGYKCMPYANDGGNAWNDTICSPIVDDPNAVGEPCTVVGNGTSGMDDCDGESMCWDVDPETNVGTCMPFCIGTDEEATCPNPCDWCSVTGDGVIRLCLPTCDPLLQNCPAGQACHAVNDEFFCTLDASEKGSGIGTPCEYINVCPPSTACVNAESVPGCPVGSVGCCAPYCSLDGADPCPGLLPGSTCQAWFEPGDGPVEGCLSAPVGACLSP